MSVQELKTKSEHDFVELVRRQFAPLSKAENTLVLAAVKGDTAVCGPNEQDNDSANDPSDSADWNPAREIRGTFIRWLFVDQRVKQYLDPRGIRIYGATITGGLDLSFVKTDFPISLRRCHVEDHINFDYIVIPSIVLTGSCISSLSADFAKVMGSVRCDKRFSANRQVHLRAAHIGGNLNFGGASFRISDKAPLLYEGIALDVESARIEGSILLRHKFSTEGGVRLYRTQIRGNLDCEGGTIVNLESSEPVALNAEASQIGGSVFLRDNFSAQGEVRLMSAEIGGFLACDGAQLRNPPQEGSPGSGTALQADGIRVSQSVLLWKDFYAEGAVRFFGAQVKGSFVCTRATLKNPVLPKVERSGIALNAETAEIAGYVHLRDSFSAEGTVRLYRSSIGLGLDCSRGKFENIGGIALDAHGAQVGGHVLLGEGFESKGVVLLSGAYLQGNLNCSNAKLNNPARIDVNQSGIALGADGIKVDGSIVFGKNFLAEGAVNLFGAEVGKNLSCEGGEFRNSFHDGISGSGTALNAEACKVTGSVFLCNNFCADGCVRLFGARIEGNVECHHAKFTNTTEGEEQNSRVTLNAVGLVIGGSLLLDHATHIGTVKLSGARISGSLRYDQALFSGLDLTDASAGWIVDDAESWPEAGTLLLDGFVYNRISGGPMDAPKRLEWLRRQASFKRQSFRQLAHVLDASGDDLGARRIHSEMQRRVWDDRHWIIRPLSWLLRLTIGYGYFPLRAVWLLLTLVFVGSVTYSAGYDVGAIVPSNREAYTYFEEHCNPPPYYERFHSVVYSLENSFPVVKLGTQERWGPRKRLASGLAEPVPMKFC